MTDQERVALRSFRRHYQKVQRAYAALRRDGELAFHLGFADGVLTSHVNLPGDDETARFMTLIRRFMNPSDSLHYPKVWRLCQSVCGEAISAQDWERIEAFIESMRLGSFPLLIDGRRVTADEAYRSVSDGGYFGDDEVAAAELLKLQNVPAIGSVVWFAFYQHSFVAFQLISVLFDIFSRAGTFVKSDPSESTGSPRCIYCLREAGKFTSEEHVFPEALGNDEILLPRGLVCDSCNNGVLSVLDQVLVDFEPVAFLRVLHVPYTKQGRFPSASFQNMTVERRGPRHVRFTAKDRTGGPRVVEELDDGWSRWTMQTRGRKFDPRPLGRALFKVAYGLLVLEEGADAARSSRYDAARQFIVSGHGFANNLVVRTVGTPHPSVKAVRHASYPGTAYVIDIFGLIFIVNLEVLPVLKVNDELAGHRFVAHSLLPHAAA